MGRFVYVRAWLMGIECMCFVIDGKFCHPLYISFLQGTLLLALNNPLLMLHRSCVFELNLFLQGGNPWLETIGKCVSITHLQFGWDHCPRTAYNSCFWEGEWLRSKVKIWEVYFIVNCLYQYIRTLLERIDDSVCFTSVIIFRRKKNLTVCTNFKSSRYFITVIYLHWSNKSSRIGKAQYREFWKELNPFPFQYAVCLWRNFHMQVTCWRLFYLLCELSL